MRLMEGYDIRRAIIFTSASLVRAKNDGVG